MILCLWRIRVKERNSVFRRSLVERSAEDWSLNISKMLKMEKPPTTLSSLFLGATAIFPSWALISSLLRSLTVWKQMNEIQGIYYSENWKHCAKYVALQIRVMPCLKMTIFPRIKVEWKRNENTDLVFLECRRNGNSGWCDLLYVFIDKFRHGMGHDNILKITMT